MARTLKPAGARNPRLAISAAETATESCEDAPLPQSLAVLVDVLVDERDVREPGERAARATNAKAATETPTSAHVTCLREAWRSSSAPLH